MQSAEYARVSTTTTVAPFGILTCCYYSTPHHSVYQYVGHIVALSRRRSRVRIPYGLPAQPQVRGTVLWPVPFSGNTDHMARVQMECNTQGYCGRHGA